MKKLITFAFGPLATFIFVVSCTQPATVNAQVATTTCPAGYTCTTASSSQILALIDAASPLNSVVQISPFVQTQNIPLAVYDLKSQNGTTSLQSLLVRFDIAGVNIGTPLSSLFSKIYIKVGSQTYLGTDSGGRAEGFNNLNIILPANIYVPISVYVDTIEGSSLDGSRINVVLNSNTTYVHAIDMTGVVVPVTGGNIYGNTIIFSTTGVQLNNTSANLGAQFCNAGYLVAPTCSQTATYSYMLTAGNNPIYLSSTVGDALTFTESATVAYKVVNYVDDNSINDGSTYFYIAPGQSKTFTLNVIEQGIGTLSVSGIKYGTSSNSLSTNTITYGLSNLTTTISLSGLTTCPVGWICSATPCYYFSTNLGIGSTGQDVIALQSFLTTQMSKRIIPMSPFTSGVFDTFTATALMAYQRVIGVPATGYFGVMTRTIVNASCSVRPPCSNTNYLSPDYLTCPKPVSPQVSVSLDPSSPVSSIVMSTSSVPLLVFDLTAKGGPVNLQSISILFNVSGANGSSGSLTNAYIYSGSKLIASTIVINSPQTGSVANFNMQNMALAANVTIPFTVKLDTIPGPSGIIVSASVNPVAVFANSSSGVASPTGSALGSPITIVSPSNSFVTLGNTSTNLGSLISNQNAPEIQQVTFSFTLTALNAPVFISNNVSTAVTKSITGDITYKVVNFYDNDSSSDSSSYFYIAPGQSKTFSINIIASNASSTQGYGIYKITSLNYGMSSANLTSNSMTSGLSNLVAVIQMVPGLTTIPVPPPTPVSPTPVSPTPTSTIAPTVSYSCPASQVIDQNQTQCWSGPVSYICPSGYTLSGQTCSHTTIDTVGINAIFGGNSSASYRSSATYSSYTCPSGYTLSIANNRCYSASTTVTTPATTSYGTLVGPSTKNYSCPSGYVLNSSNMCSAGVGYTSPKANTASVWDSFIYWLASLFE